MSDFTNKPCADKGLISYRYKFYGWVMIGAKNHEDGLNEAKRSINKEPEIKNLQIWNGEKYIDVAQTL